MAWYRLPLRFNLLVGSSILVCTGCLVSPPAATSTRSSTASPVSPEDLLASARAKGPWDVRFLKEADGLRNGPDYDGATIYYPVYDADTLMQDQKFPIMAFCPGFQGSERSMAPWGKFMASHGVVTITLGTNSLSDSPPARGRALLDALETVRRENTREGSPLSGKLAVNHVGVAGWSMGGGGAQHAAVKEPKLRGAVAMLPWQPGYAFEHEVPVLILAGEQDRIASAERNARPHFEQTPSGTIKSYFEIKNGTHLVVNRPSNRNGDIGAWVLAWVKTFVEGDPRYEVILDQKPPSSSWYVSDRKK